MLEEGKSVERVLALMIKEQQKKCMTQPAAPIPCPFALLSGQKSRAELSTERWEEWAEGGFFKKDLVMFLIIQL